MGFRINTNVAAMNAHTNATLTNRGLDSSLSKLSSGLRINSAADDASGLAIADSLRSQGNSLGQAVRNANDGISIIQIADKAMDEQLKILDTIKVKATQASQDGQSSQSREALQKDITRLLESLDNIAKTTSYNGQTLLSGAFNDKEFQIGAYSGQTVNASIGATTMDKIGHVRYETNTITGGASAFSATSVFSLTVNGVDLESAVIGGHAGEGVGAIADIINKNTELTGVRASYSVDMKITAAGYSVGVGSLVINGVKIGTLTGTVANDADGQIVNAINAVTVETGVFAYTDESGALHLKSNDGRAIQISSASGIISAQSFVGNLTLVQLNAGDINLSGSTLAFTAAGTTLNLSDTLKLHSLISMDAFNVGAVGVTGTDFSLAGDNLGVGVTTFVGAQVVMNMAESAQIGLDSIRSDLGSVQNQLVSTVNNISVTQVNVAAAESQIRDVDFAAESAQFSKLNILAQSGSYAMSQANAVQQNVLRLLQ